MTTTAPTVEARPELPTPSRRRAGRSGQLLDLRPLLGIASWRWCCWCGRPAR